ncbi:unnamed protein product [Adineta steineri]|uniref:Methyltransferase FkbM domain-containing protein n=2 Tax=Adineta steineri TaxID=433720 RepID=A0A814STD8_9BILA|nr:unnamed protein product [Adineta steineri]
MRHIRLNHYVMRTREDGIQQAIKWNKGESKLGTIIIELYYYITGQTISTLNSHQTEEEIRQRRRDVKQIYIAITTFVIIIIFFVIIFIFLLFISDDSIISKINTYYTGRTGEIDRNSPFYHHRRIYIDIGCFNGETIEYFIHFTMNSAFYEIYTFEPDPDNYRLCKQRLSQRKYRNFNIKIIQKVAWIRDERVYFRTERGRQSRISLNVTEDDGESIELDAIDFSSWLARLVKPNEALMHIKMSMPGAEVPVLEKMIRDNTLGLANKYEVEWIDRNNPRIRPIRIYIQLMFDSYGFECLYYTRVQDAKKVYQMNGAFDNITKYYDWRKLSESDTLAHYVERPDMLIIENMI